MRLASEVPSLLVDTVGGAELLENRPGVLAAGVLGVALAVEGLCGGFVDAIPRSTALNASLLALLTGVWLDGLLAIE